MNEFRLIPQAAVLGAGVMGAQIAAQLTNVGLRVWLFELPAEEGDASAPARKAIAQLARLKPAPLAYAAAAARIVPANYREHLDVLRHCPLVLEAVAERLEIKQALYQQIAPALAPDAVLASNTSGIPLRLLAADLPADLAARFCGVHFFNPPRYQKLVELVPHARTDAAVLDRLEGWLTRVVGKDVLRAHDTPGFIGNRIGVFALLSAMHHAGRLGLPLDLVDRLTGVGIGRPKSATFRTADVVGLDTLAHVVDGLQQALPDDPFRAVFRLPEWLRGLVAAGALGQKTGRGVYDKRGSDIYVYEPAQGDYRRVRRALDPELRAALKSRQPAEKFAALTHSAHPQAELIRSTYFDLLHYCAVHLAGIADSAREVDLALRWGYGWQYGPFESWQAIGARELTDRLEAYIDSGQALASTPLPAWVQERADTGFHTAQGSWSAGAGDYMPRPAHPVYRRQRVPELLHGEPAAERAVLYENPGVVLWLSDGEIPVLSFKTKLNTIGVAVLDGVAEALGVVERGHPALILWQPAPPFSAGANLMEFVGAVMEGKIAAIEPVVRQFQDTTRALRMAPVPVVAAVSGLALGGGCEFLLHCDRVVAAQESQVGLVETSVGLIPAGGGCKELARRAALEARGGDPFPALARYFEQVALAKVSGSAEEARELGYLADSDPILPQARELLFVAESEALALAVAGYRPPFEQEIAVAGSAGLANLHARLANLHAGGFISDHDLAIANRLAHALCGGELAAGSLVSEAWLLKLERQAFMELLAMEKTQERVFHMLEHGKPLRN